MSKSNSNDQGTAVVTSMKDTVLTVTRYQYMAAMFFWSGSDSRHDKFKKEPCYIADRAEGTRLQTEG